MLNAYPAGVISANGDPLVVRDEIMFVNFERALDIFDTGASDGRLVEALLVLQVLRNSKQSK
jgi:hypothetical protein